MATKKAVKSLEDIAKEHGWRYSYDEENKLYVFERTGSIRDGRGDLAVVDRITFHRRGYGECKFIVISYVPHDSPEGTVYMTVDSVSGERWTSPLSVGYAEREAFAEQALKVFNRAAVIEAIRKGRRSNIVATEERIQHARDVHAKAVEILRGFNAAFPEAT